MLAATPKNGFGADLFSIGVDEAGRGPLAGPVVAGAVVLCKPCIAGLDDSKKLSAKRRAELDLIIRERCAWAVGIVDVEQIDALNILGATMLAMTQAVTRLTRILAGAPHEILIDGNLSPSGRCASWKTDEWGTGRPIVGGDALEPAISAASIVAKEWRDRLMLDAARIYPQYGWERNKGYGTKDHMAALREHGPTPLHRRSFAPVAQYSLL
ncbi:MAG: ribonuclease HII [Pontixanthobacter sp.]